MNSSDRRNRPSTKERIALNVFWGSSILFALNILIGKASILWGWDLFKLGNVGEFLLLLVASISVIAAALHREAAENETKETTEL